MVLNIGSFGLEVGYFVLFLVVNVLFVFIFGGIKEKFWVVKGEVVLCIIMNVFIVMDYWMLDVLYGG